MLPLLVLSFLIYIPEYYGYGDDFHRNWKLLPESCGTGKYVSRIIGGKVAGIGQFPWMAKLGYLINSNSIRFQCGGSLISEYYVLTAAHCLENKEGKPFILIIRLGEFDLSTRIDCDSSVCAPPVQDIPAEYYINHYGYVGGTEWRNDISLVRLFNRAQLNEFVQPICLPQGRMLERDFEVSGSMVVAGWGKIGSDTLGTPDKLLYVRLPMMDVEICEQQYQRVLMKSQLCMGQGDGRDSCSGDSGGPAMKRLVLHGGRRYFLIGVTSYGVVDCGKAPAVYTNVAYYIKWILDNLRP